MSKMLSFRGFCIRCLNAGLVALLLAILVPLSVNAASHVPNQSQATCLQAPANLDPTNLSITQLESYGLPLRPPSSASSQARSRWLQLANRIKHDHHDCIPQLASDTRAVKHTNIPVNSAAPWAGFAAIGGTYTNASATWNLPCINTNVRPAGVSMWVGLGIDNVEQAGTDAFVDGNGNVSYKFWYELDDVSIGVNYFHGYYNLSVPNPCNAQTQMYVEVDSPGNPYYIIDGGGTNRSFQPNWPSSVVSSGECMVEDSHHYGNFDPLANFGAQSFYGCAVNYSLDLGFVNPTAYVMHSDSNGNPTMANPGGFFNNSSDFNVYWRRAS
ncbi:MAG: G1 family glutamic endopeptidase [Ktedonobacteraceae bacterium]